MVEPSPIDAPPISNQQEGPISTFLPYLVEILVLAVMWMYVPSPLSIQFSGLLAWSRPKASAILSFGKGLLAPILAVAVASFTYFSLKYFLTRTKACTTTASSQKLILP